jgi:hypothetical protein
MSNKFENINIIDEEIKINDAYNRVIRLFDKYALKEDDPDFKELYGEVKIKDDLEYIERMEKIFKEVNSTEQNIAFKKAAIFEYIVYEQSELGDWFGKQALTFKTTKSDDLRYKVDMAIEFEEPNKSFGYLGLAVDVCFGVEFSEKFTSIKENIDSGKLTQIDYFKSPRTGPKGLKNVPRVVLAVDGKTMNQLIDLWIEKSQDSKDKLANHPVQIQILTEFQLQLTKFEQYARHVKKNNEIADIYAHDLAIIEKILKEKKKEFPNYTGEMFDAGYDHIQNGLSIFDKEIAANLPPDDLTAKREAFFRPLDIRYLT